MQFTHEHEELRRTLKRFIDDQINPHVDEWEDLPRARALQEAR
jgi:citronellyl-CoA dehydrogenase